MTFPALTCEWEMSDLRQRVEGYRIEPSDDVTVRKCKHGERYRIEPSDDVTVRKCEHGK
jgi:hypothetical protein